MPNDDRRSVGQWHGVGDATAGQRPSLIVPRRVIIKGTGLERRADRVEVSVPRDDCGT